jgi:hypothetical protein
LPGWLEQPLAAPIFRSYFAIMSLRFDATLKAIVAERPGDFATVFGLPAGQPVTPLNVDLSTITAATDVALAYGEPISTIVDLNFQTGPDPTLPGRLHLYNAALHHRYDVAVRSILVLLRPKADAAILTGSLTYGEGRARVEFGYEVIRLWQQPVDAYLRGGVAALPLATLCQMPASQPLLEALREVVRAIEQRLGQEASPTEAARLMTATHVLTGLRVKKPDLASIYQGVGLMSELAAYDEAVEDGEIKGRHWVLLRLGQQRFGPPEPNMELELKSIRDLDRLGRLTAAILTVKSWPELLATS